jgi:hypothetical protein
MKNIRTSDRLGHHFLTALEAPAGARTRGRLRPSTLHATMLKGPLNRFSSRSRGLGDRFSTANGRFSTGIPGNGHGFPQKPLHIVSEG